jgi:hypothetical protein
MQKRVRVVAWIISGGIETDTIASKKAESVLMDAHLPDAT